MPKKFCLRGFIIKQHGKRAKAFLKFEWQHLFYIYWSLCRQLTCKISLLVLCKISTLFPNTLTTDGNSSPLNRDNLMQPIQIHLSQKQKTFSEFFSASLKSNLNLEPFQKNMTLIVDLCPKLRTPKNLVRSMPKKSFFRGSYQKQHRKRAQTLLKFKRQHLYIFYWSLWRQLSCKMFLLVRYKISRLFPNTLKGDGMYSLLNRDNLTQTIQMQLSQKKLFSDFFLDYWNAA